MQRQESAGAAVVVKWAGGRCRDGPLAPAAAPGSFPASSTAAAEPSNAPQNTQTSAAAQSGPAHMHQSSAATQPQVSDAAPGTVACASRQQDLHASTQHDTASSEYSSDDSELPGEALHFFLQMSAQRFSLHLRDLDPMHCLEADKSDAQGLLEPDAIALFHSVVWSGCLGFFLTL